MRMPCYEKCGGTLSDLIPGSLVLAVSLDIMQSGNNDEWILLERNMDFLSCFDFIAARSGEAVIAIPSKFWINEELVTLN